MPEHGELLLTGDVHRLQPRRLRVYVIGLVDLGSVEAAAFSADIPTLSEWSLILLSVLLLAVAVWKLRAF